MHKIKQSARGTNIHVLENESISIDGITFHGSSLWTDFELLGDPRVAGFECQQKMNDYHFIKRDPSYSKLRSVDMHVMHKESLQWLEKSLSESTSKTNVVVTHHAPSIKSIPEKYQVELVSAGYASNLESFIQKARPDIWIHGHILEACDYYIGQTRVICNPKGYPGETAAGFRDNLIVELKA